MATNQNSVVVGVFEDEERAQRAVTELKSAGFDDGQIGFAMRGGESVSADMGDGDTETTGMSDTDTRGGTREGGVMGAITGASLGSIVGAAAALLLPGVGPVLAGGILAAALTGAAVGAATGGLAGALREWGFSEHEAAYYHGELEAGRTIVTVRADGREDEARAILQSNGGYDAGTRGSTMSAYTGTSNRNATTDSGNDVIQLREEELVANKQPVEAGQVEVRKTVEERQQDVPVNLKREEVTIERHAVDRPISGEIDNVEDEVVRMPVYEEQAQLDKQTRVTEEVVIGKEAVQSQETLSGTVRRENVEVTNTGDVNVRGEADLTNRDANSMRDRDRDGS
jgi:uncharacterized protein (TIGR02271 family)